MKIIFQTPESENYFFGYYDKSPLNTDNTKLLACKSSFIDRMPTSEDVLEIGFFYWQESNKFIKFTETRAWNWQQGCMLQWLGPDFSSKIVYNDRINNQFVSIVMDINNKEKIILPMAIYAVHPSGRYALCIDNERHYWFRPGYSYQGIVNRKKSKPIDEADGIWLLDIESNKVEQIITLGDLLKINPLSNMKDAIHYVEHLVFSPSGRRFCFLHRWVTSSGVIFSRFFTANLDGSDIFLLNDSGRMSHFCWQSDENLVGWGAMKTIANTFRKNNIGSFIIKKLMPLYRKLIGGNSVDGNTTISRIVSGDSYILFKDCTYHKKRILVDKCKRDGHPSFHPFNKSLMIIDTYPDRNDNFIAYLYSCDIKTEKVKLIDKIPMDKEYFGSPCRADLHPKFSFDGKYICIDTLINGCRGMRIYSV